MELIMIFCFSTFSLAGIEESSEESTAYRTEDDVDFPSDLIGPSQEHIVNATEQITKKIQELLQAAQVGKNSRYDR